MNIREQQEDLEKRHLSEFATLSVGSKGRQREEEKCNIRTEFQRDKDSNILKIIKIKHTKDIDIMQDMENIEFIETKN